LTHGWDVTRAEDRDFFKKTQRKLKPHFLIASPECKAFSQIMNINWSKMSPEKIKEILKEGLMMWDYSLEAIEAQLNADRYFGLEHPGLASSWTLPQTQKLLQRPDVALITFDMCEAGLQVHPEGGLSRKATKIATNNPWLAAFLSTLQCTGLHAHRPLENGLPALAQVYPDGLCKGIARSIESSTSGLKCPALYSSVSSPKAETWNFVSTTATGEEVNSLLNRKATVPWIYGTIFLKSSLRSLLLKRG
jgi:hypothetical protein